jgi:hypothetical protein
MAFNIVGFENVEQNNLNDIKVAVRVGVVFVFEQ